jgi:hypothetical protein
MHTKTSGFILFEGDKRGLFCGNVREETMAR